MLIRFPVQGYRNKLEAVQVPNIHSAVCSLCSKVAILYLAYKHIININEEKHDKSD